MGRIAHRASFIVLAIISTAALAACGDDGGNMLPGEVDTAIDDGPAALTNQAAATFTFHATPMGTAFVCAVDDAAGAACTSPFTATVAEGDHKLAVAALDARGDADPSPATRTWRVDLTPPDTAITAQPAAIDSSPNPSFEFTGTDGGGGTLTFECALDGAAFAACTSPQALTALADGPHTFAARAIDAATNVDPTPAMAMWTIDTTSPDTTITAGPADTSVSNATPSFAFASTVTPATFECKLDGGTFAACASPFVPAPALVDGMHAFSVRAKDAHGVVDPTPATRTWMVDAIAPDVAITAQPANPSNQAMPVFAFTSSDASATFECALGAAGYTACASPYTVPSIADGSNTFHVRAVDAVGNRTATPASYTWVTDTIAPGLAITSQPPATSNNPTPQITFSFTGGPTTITCQVDTGAAAACTSPYKTAPLGEGTHTITVAVSDAAGNTTTKTTNPFAIDLTPPVVTITSGPPNPTNGKTPVFAFTATGAATTLCQMDGGGFSACTSPYTSAALTDGSHTFSVRAVDSVNNASTVSQTFVVDTAAPVLTITSAPSNPSNQATATFVFTVTGGPATTTCQLDGGAATACTSPYTTGTLTEASHTVTIVATDAAGNAAPQTRTFTVDLTAPTVTITTPPPSPTNQKTATIAFTVSGGATSTQCQLDGSAFASCSSPYTTPTLTDGSHQFVVKATDAAGNPGTAMTTWTIDTGAPVVTITGGPAGTVKQTTASIPFTVTGTAVSIQCQLDTGAFAACTSPYNLTGLADGSHTVTVKATDAASNSGSDFLTWTVDTTAPVVTITSQPPANTNVNPVTVAFTVTGGAISTTCAIDGGAAASCTSPFTASLADGAHAIVVTATDFVGNAQSKTASFTLDTVAPTVTITSAPGALTNQQKPPIAFATAGSPSAVTCQIDAGAFAACTSPFAPATALADGSHTITVKVVDLAGNASMDSTTFTVDATPPTVTITAQPPASWNMTSASITFTTAGSPTAIDCSLDGGAFAACTTMTSYAVTGLAEASHTMTVRVTDAAGNTNTASATFVVDVTPPTVTITTAFATPTNNNKPPIAFTTAGAPTSIQCQIDTGAVGACASPFTPGAALTEGAHTITVKATDAAGNAGSDSVAFTVDTIAPTVTINSGPANPTNDATPTITFTPAGSPTVVECKVDAGAYAACTSPFTVATALSEASHTITVRVTDAAGNQNLASTTFTVDVTPPTLAFTATPPALTNVANQSIAWTQGGSPTSVTCSLDGGAFAACTSPFATGAVADGAHAFVVKATDAATNSAQISTSWTSDTAGPSFSITAQPAANTNDPNPATAFTVPADATVVECQINSGAFAACTSPFAPALAEGTYTIAVREKDAAGNATSHATGSFTVDRTPPVIALGAIASPSNNATPSLTFSADQAGDVFMCAADAGALAPCTSPFAATLAEGSHTITVQATDAAGNTSSKTTPAFVIDLTAPTVTITAQPATPSNDPTPTFSFTATFDAVDAPSTTLCRVDAGAFVACTSPYTAAAQADGAHTLTVKVTDAAGNASSATTSSFTIDTSAPGLTASGPGNGWPVHAPSWTFSSTDATATFKCRTSAIGTFAPCTSPWTPTLPSGKQTITIVAGDAAGNSSPGRLFVVDNDPVVMCLDGATDHGDMTSSGVVNDLTTATIEFWFRGGASTSEQLVNFDVPADGSNTSAVEVAVSGSSFIVTVDARNAGGALNQTQFTPTSFDLAAWHHYAAEFTGSAIRFFIDGSEVTTKNQLNGSAATSFADAFGSVTTPIGLHVGYFARDNNSYAVGGLLDLRVSNTVRYVASFVPTFPIGATPDAASVLQYGLDDGSTTTSIEDHSAAFDLTWTAADWSATACFP